MPLDAVNFRDTAGRYEHRLSRKTFSAKTQAQLNSISASQSQKSPTQCNAISLLYLSACLLPHLRCAANSADETRRTILPAQESLPDSARSNTTHMPDAISHVSANNTLCLTSAFSPRRGGASTTPRLKKTPRRTFPAVEALSPVSPPDFLRWDRKNSIMIADGEAGKQMLLNLAKQFFINVEGVSATRANDLEFAWRVAAANGPISIARLDMEYIITRRKRISLKDAENTIIAHITEHCATETEIYNSEGLSEGKLLLLTAQRLDNPFRMIYDDIDGYTPDKNIEFISSGANYLFNLITIGIKPLILSPIANHYRHEYYQWLGDEICATRQQHLTLAQIATSLDITGMQYTAASKKVPPIPKEFLSLYPYPHRPTYVSHNKNTNTKKAFSLFSSRKTPSEKEKGKEKLLKSKGGNEFETYYPNANDHKGKRMRVIYDETDNIWRYDEPYDISPLNVRIEEGETFISLQGKHFPLRRRPDRKLEIITLTRERIEKRLPVYQDPLSKSWHLHTKNGELTYTPTQRHIIDKIKIEPKPHFQYHAIKNLHPDIYGNGKLYEVRNLQDNVATTPPLYTVVEMNGSLVPVKKAMKPKSGMHYSAYDVHNPVGEEYLLDWDGFCWSMEKTTSPHVSESVQTRITPDMFASDLDEKLLSSPDAKGISWLGERGYLNIKGGYVEINTGTLTRIGPEGGKTINTYYRDQQFHSVLPSQKNFQRRILQVEAFYERMKEISQQHFQSEIKFFEIERAAKLAYVSNPIRSDPSNTATSSGAVHVEAVPSTHLDRKRYLVTLNDDDYFFVEISHDGKQVWVLLDQDSDRAMKKYQRSQSGNDIPRVIALKRNIDTPAIRPVTRDQINANTTSLINVGAALIQDTLKRLNISTTSERSLIVGHADFFTTSRFENNVFSSPGNAYHALIDAFIPLSKNHPKTIIVPGSLYISQDIPKRMQHQRLMYQQGNQQRSIGSAINFSAVLVPVFYNGKFISIARKGEYLTYSIEGAMPDDPETVLDNLDKHIPTGATLKVNNAKSYPFVDVSEWNDSLTGTILAGKTLFPHEKLHADWFFCPCRDKNGTEMEVEKFFSSEFIIDDTKFMIVIEDEFIQQENNSKRPKVRTMVFPTNETLDESNRYDWIIHVGSYTELDDTMRTASYNYLMADRLSNSEFYSDISQRTVVKTHMEEKHLTIYEFTPDIT